MLTNADNLDTLSPDQQAEYLKGAIENASEFEPEQQVSLIKSFGTQLLSMVGITKAVKSSSPVPAKKDDSQKDDKVLNPAPNESTAPVAATKSDTGGIKSVGDVNTEVSTEDLDDSNNQSGADVEDQNAKDADSDEVDPDELDAEVPSVPVRKSHEEAESEDNAPIGYDVTELLGQCFEALDASRHAVEQSSVVISKSLEREAAKDAVIERQSQVIEGLTAQVQELGGAMVTALGGVAHAVQKSLEREQALQNDLDSQPVGSAQAIAKSVEASSGADDDTPVGQGAALLGLEGVAERVQDVRNISKSMESPTTEKRFGITQTEYSNCLYEALHDETLCDKYDQDRTVFDVEVKKSLGEAPRKVVQLVADYLGKLPEESASS